MRSMPIGSTSNGPGRLLRSLGCTVAIAVGSSGAACNASSVTDQPVTPPPVPSPPSPPPAPAATPLKEAYEPMFLIGAALNETQFSEWDTAAVALIGRHFNTITAENVLKWQLVHPEPGRYDFAASDRFVAFGEKYGMHLVGHALVWHNQTPAWVFQDGQGNPAGRDTLLARMRDHIRTVVGRYRGRIHGWDVVNEALNEDGTLRASPWRTIIGDDYIAKAFQYAREADPDVELYYNDFSLENEPKRLGAIALVRSLQDAGVPIDGIGLQGHNNLVWPSAELQDQALTAFRELGIKIMVTELDLDVLPRAAPGQVAEVSFSAAQRDDLDPFRAGLPDSVARRQAERYGALFGVYRKHRDVLTRVTFWGVRDGDSWLNDWPIRGRINYPLLFDRQGRPKRAFDAVVEAAR